MLILYIYNVTGGDVSDYEYEVMVNKDQIARGEVKKYKRSNGWAKLVKKIIDKEIKHGNNT